MCRYRQGEWSKKETLPLVFDAGKTKAPVTVLGGSVASHRRDGAQQRGSGVHQRENPHPDPERLRVSGRWSWGGSSGWKLQPEHGKQGGRAQGPAEDIHRPAQITWTASDAVPLSLPPSLLSLLPSSAHNRQWILKRRSHLITPLLLTAAFKVHIP